ncbi:hypothetical protein [Erwinia phyllosphaerae]|uniref:hypothetical protein n=1 Tax=Erwinia phyllosphaerae TaxID=2853256 RepID=UPI001FEF0898|nr:hypothetical protein [Erwinia phyllosphaerae]MBV4368165.1 hypothetical protein [Erwinia phyllosphaerae]
MTPEQPIEWFKWVPFFSLLATIAGWIISSYLASRNTSRHASNAELNRLIDSLYKGLDEIYDQMLDLVTKEYDDHEKTVSYHKFVSMVQNVRFICNAIVKMDNGQQKADSLVAELRQACTDDKKYSPKMIGIALPEIRDIQERIKNNFNKKFN